MRKKLLVVLLCLSFFFSCSVCSANAQQIQITEEQLATLENNFNKQKEINKNLRSELKLLLQQLHEAQKQSEMLQTQLNELKALSQNQTELLKKTEESYENSKKKLRRDIGIKVGTTSTIRGVSYGVMQKVLKSDKYLGYRIDFDWVDKEPSLWLVYGY